MTSIEVQSIEVWEMNWVEKRWTCERNLVTGAPEVWQSVSTALDNACQSLQEHYASLNGIEFRPQNGHRALITVTRNQIPAGVEQYHSTVNVQVIFEPFENRINVIVGYNKNPKHFPIKSDETHAF